MHNKNEKVKLWRVMTAIVFGLIAVWFIRAMTTSPAAYVPQTRIASETTTQGIFTPADTTEAYSIAESTPERTTEYINLYELPVEALSNVNQRTTLAYDREAVIEFLTVTVSNDSEIEPPTVEEADEWESLGEFTLTAYCLCRKCCGIWSAEHPSRVGTDYVQKTASGTIPEAEHTVGANTDILPFGTVVLIDGHEYTVEDKCGAAKNKPLIDIYFTAHDEAVEFGRQISEVWVRK